MQIPYKGHYTRESWEARLRWLERETGRAWPHLARSPLDPAHLRGHIENYIGAVSVPVGLAGPLLLHGEHAQGMVLAPFATTEGALVASACRGAKALSRAGGTTVRVLAQRMMRAPVFQTASLRDALRLGEWLIDHQEALGGLLKQYSAHSRLVQIEPRPLGRQLHAIFWYETADAAGQNMTTIGTNHLCQWIIEQVQAQTDIGVSDYIVAGNMEGDKKTNQLAWLRGRGMEVMAEATLPAPVIREVLRAEPQALYRCLRHIQDGAIAIGAQGFDVNVANVLAAIFTATGQDIACVHESALAQLHFEWEGDGLYVAMRLPALVIGTVGGGTGLPAQQEALSLMGCDGPGKAPRLGEIIAGFCLALDLSTSAAIAGGQFAAAHERLGRRQEGLGLQPQRFTAAWFQQTLAPAPAPDWQVQEVEVAPLATGNSILSELGHDKFHKWVGHYRFSLRWTAGQAQGQTRLVLKSKPSSDEMTRLVAQLARACGPAVAEAYLPWQRETGFSHTAEREVAAYRLPDPALRRIQPLTYATWAEPERECYGILMEDLRDLDMLGQEAHPEAWQPAQVQMVLDDLAAFHAAYLGRTHLLDPAIWAHRQDSDSMRRMRPLWEALWAHHRGEFPQLVDAARYELVAQLIEGSAADWERLDAAPRTLIHNDCNPRNLGLRPGPDGHRLVLYDWELARCHVPQHDLCEFLAFVLPPETAAAEREAWVETYRQALARHSGQALPAADFLATFRAAARDFTLNRLGLYLMAHTFKDYDFLPGVLRGMTAYVQTTV